MLPEGDTVPGVVGLLGVAADGVAVSPEGDALTGVALLLGVRRRTFDS